MADNQANEKRAIEALTGGSVECVGVVASHEETLTPKGARDIVNILKLADLKVVPVE